jgi:hypothetical protein
VRCGALRAHLDEHAARLALTFDALVADLETKCRRISTEHGTRKLNTATANARDIIAAIADVRDMLKRGKVQQATAQAVIFGILIGLAGAKEARGRSAAVGGRTRGKAIAAEAAAILKGHNIQRLVRRWKASADADTYGTLRDQYPTLIAYLADQTGLPAYTIIRRLKRLGLA